jgi:Crossover junction endodeoxyribonuclease RuvC
VSCSPGGFDLFARICAVSAIDCTHMRVLGVDCGGEYTGYGMVEMHSGGRLACLTCGAIKLSTREPLARQLSRIYDELGALIREHRPDEVAIEGIFLRAECEVGIEAGAGARSGHAGRSRGRAGGRRVFAADDQIVAVERSGW